MSEEQGRWELTIKVYQKDLQNVVGDCAIGAAFLSYAGPFDQEYRVELVEKCWTPIVKRLKIPVSEHFAFSKFLASPEEIRDWNISGLPADEFSEQNGLLMLILCFH